MFLVLVSDVIDNFCQVVANRLMGATWSPERYRNLLLKDWEFLAKMEGRNTLHLHGNIRRCPCQWDSDKDVNMVRLNVNFNTFTAEVVKYISYNLFASFANFIYQNLPVIFTMEDHMVVHHAHRFFWPVLKCFRFHGSLLPR